jgi:sulfur-carrier protein adenylyltransferase/sulfurtransferase
MLSEKEKQRYSRHILLDKVGLSGQEKLKSARVLVIGAGGLSCPALQYLTAAGVGNIGIIDFDTVDESNLQRQILFNPDDIGKNKAIIASQKLSKQNSHVKFDVYSEKLTNKNALELFSKYDIIVDGTDNFATRYLINDACILVNKPFVYGGIYKFEGQVSVFNFEDGASYRCLFPTPPDFAPNCSEIGVLGILPGIIGTIQATEVLKMILKIGDILSGKLLIYNALESSSIKINIKKSDEQIQKVLEMRDEFKNYDYDYFCEVNYDNKIKEISSEELKQILMTEGVQSFQIIDVREEWEIPKISELNAKNIPLGEIPNRLNELDNFKHTIVCCQSGIRSRNAIKILEKEGFANIINLKDGINSW